MPGPHTPESILIDADFNFEDGDSLWDDGPWAPRRMGGEAIAAAYGVEPAGEPKISIPKDQVELDIPDDDDGETIYRGRE